MINAGDSTAVVKEQIEDAVSLAGYSAPTSWTDATDKINDTADQFERDQIADGMNGGLARDRINALFGGPVWAPEGAQLTIDFAANKAWTRNSAVTDSVDAVDLTRAGSVLMLGPNGYQSFPAGELARIDGIGAQVAPARVNKCTNFNANPVDLTGVISSGSVLVSVVDDVAELAAAGLSALASSGKVYKAVRSGAGAWINIDGAVGNLNPHTISVIARTVGTTLSLGFSNGLSLNNMGAPASYARAAFTVTPTVNTVTMQLVINSDGGTVYFILNQLEEGSYASPPIITSGAAVSRPGDILSASVADGGRVGVLDFDLLEPPVGTVTRVLVGYGDGVTVSPSSPRFQIAVTAAGFSYIQGNNAGSSNVGFTGPSLVQGRNTLYYCLSGVWQLGRVGSADPAAASRVSPVGVSLVGFGTNGVITSGNTFIHARRFAERSVTDFATPADAFAWAKSVAQGWA